MCKNLLLASKLRDRGFEVTDRRTMFHSPIRARFTVVKILTSPLTHFACSRSITGCIIISSDADAKSTPVYEFSHRRTVTSKVTKDFNSLSRGYLVDFFAMWG